MSRGAYGAGRVRFSARTRGPGAGSLSGTTTVGSAGHANSLSLTFLLCEGAAWTPRGLLCV